MKTQKFRKKALLSSVAMLLVAAVAVGSATFAWFTTSTSATADRLAVHTTKASELQVKTNFSTTYTDHAFFMGTGVDQILKPASSANGTDWFHATAADKSAMTASSAGFVACETSELDAYRFAGTMQIKNNGGATVKGVKIEFTMSETGTQKYARVAVVKAGDSFASNVYAMDNTKYQAAKAAGAVSATTTQEITPKNASAKQTITVGDLAAGAESSVYDVYVWFEGQDAQCYDTYAGNAVPNVQFNITGTTDTAQS